MCVNLGGVETFLLHECFGAVGRALAFTTDAVDVNVVSHDVRHIHRHFLVGKGGQTNTAAAVDHVHCVVHRAGRCRTFDDIIDALAAIEPFDLGHDIRRLADVHDRIGA